MPSRLNDDAPCPACGRRHQYCLPVGEVQPGREYEYVCPESGRRSTLRADAGGRPVRYYPQGAVQLAPSQAADRSAA
jgi:hypothetical protein